MNARVALRAAALLALCSTTSGCGSSAEDPSAAAQALDSLQQTYDDLTDGDFDKPMQWASEDLKKIGDWEYRVLEIGNVAAADLEAALNEAGAERWEVIWMEKTLDGHSIVMKRPAVSYLSKVPLSQIGRIVVGGSESEQ